MGTKNVNKTEKITSKCHYKREAHVNKNNKEKKQKRRDKRKDKTQETKKIKQAVSNVTALR
jgi:hypothetical protein